MGRHTRLTRPKRPRMLTGSGGGRRPVAGDHGIDAQVVERAGGDRGRDRGALAAGHRDAVEIPALPGRGSADNQPDKQNNRLPRHATSDRWHKATHRPPSRIIVPNPLLPTTLDASPRRPDPSPPTPHKRPRRGPPSPTPPTYSAPCHPRHPPARRPVTHATHLL